MSKNKLQKYTSKRDFNKTIEPMGTKKKRENHLLSFVVQLHYATTKHYDFRLEYDGVLLSWAVPKGPSFNPIDKRLAIQVEDHPIDYKDFEGIIPQGEYGGGSVIIFDQGYYLPLEKMSQAIKEGKIKFYMEGIRLKGLWMLLRKDEKNWFLMKLQDEFCKKSAGISRMKRSVISNLTNQELEKKYHEKN